MADLFDLHSFLKATPHQPGVYRMHSATEQVLYVGKAKNLKKRLSSYFREQTDSKVAALISAMHHITYTVTHTETEALLLEQNFIKKYRPRYNVLLKDDKSYPYILISAHKHPKVGLYRGEPNHTGQYFGPYPSKKTVQDSLHLIQKTFGLRSCSDNVYASRKRPCLLYQLKRCLGPCVAGFVSDEHYQQQVQLAQLFLQGRDQQILDVLVQRMEQASQRQAYEQAASYRDQIQSIRRVHEQQSISGLRVQDLDVIGFANKNHTVCLHVLFIRQGRVYGSNSYFPKVPEYATPEDVLEAFILQFYLQSTEKHSLPQEILVDTCLKDAQQISRALSDIHQRKTAIKHKLRAQRQQLIKLANTNAISTLEAKLAQTSSQLKRLQALESWLDLQAPIERMECFDISHTQGECTVASCVVFDRNGPLTSEWRRYHINNITPGDDYAAMEQTIRRRFRSVSDESHLPDILFVDGGKGQLTRVKNTLEDVLSPQNYTAPLLIGIAKGVSRKPGMETLFVNHSHTQKTLEKHSPALHLIQHIRDESHRFAITGHRLRRNKARITSRLENIPGVGHKRRQQLLTYLGGLQEVQKATIQELAEVPGISQSLAQRIYHYLHG